MSKKVEKDPNNSKESQKNTTNFSSSDSKETKQKEKEKVAEPELEKDKQLEQLKKKVNDLEKEIKTLKEKNLRSLADLSNQSKIHAKELNEIIKYSNEKLINQLLFLPDNYERAMQAVQQIGQENPKKDLEKELKRIESELQKETNPSKKMEWEEKKKKTEQWVQSIEIFQKKINNLLEGLQMILQWFQNFLQKQGVEEIKVIPGKDIFDATLHETFLEKEESNDYPEETILQVLQKGYQIHQRVLRKAMVKISKKKT